MFSWPTRTEAYRRAENILLNYVYLMIHYLVLINLISLHFLFSRFLKFQLLFVLIMVIHIFGTQIDFTKHKIYRLIIYLLLEGVKYSWGQRANTT